MKYKGLKLFLLKVFIGSIPVQLFLMVIGWIYFVELQYEVGDLGRLGKIRFDKDYSSDLLSPKLESIDVDNYEEGDTFYDVVTIGDSFSQQGINGYQNFLAHKSGYKITNIQVDRAKTSPEQMAVLLLNDNRLPPNVKYLIVETVEREVPIRWSGISFSTKPDKLPFLSKKEEKTGLFVNISNTFKLGRDWIKLNLNLVPNPVKKAALSKDCFGMPGCKSTLYFYCADLETISISEKTRSTIAENIKKMKRLCEEKGIRLIFIFVPDKYEIYQYFIKDNQYEKKLLGEQLSTITDSLDFAVNPRMDFINMVREGEKDLYLPNDSHWSWKGSSKVADLIYEKMGKQNVKID